MDFLTRESKKNGEQIGLSILGSISAFSVWSALNPSVFTISAFMTTDKISSVRLGMNAGLGLNLLLALALAIAYKKKGYFPALITGITGVGLWVAYDQMIKKANLQQPRLEN